MTVLLCVCTVYEYVGEGLHRHNLSKASATDMRLTEFKGRLLLI
jgi:hypothetical protein